MDRSYTYTTIEEVKECFDNLMDWDKKKFANLIQKYADQKEEVLTTEEVLENYNITLSDVLNEFDMDDIINGLGGKSEVLEWFDEKDIMEHKNPTDLLDAMDDDVIINYVLDEGNGLREEIMGE